MNISLRIPGLFAIFVIFNFFLQGVAHFPIFRIRFRVVLSPTLNHVHQQKGTYQTTLKVSKNCCFRVSQCWYYLQICPSNCSGKSSLTVQFVDGHFIESYYPTIENTFRKTLKWRNHEYACEIVDTAGQVLAR